MDEQFKCSILVSDLCHRADRGWVICNSLYLNFSGCFVSAWAGFYNSLAVHIRWYFNTLSLFIRFNRLTPFPIRVGKRDKESMCLFVCVSTLASKARLPWGSKPKYYYLGNYYEIKKLETPTKLQAKHKSRPLLWVKRMDISIRGASYSDVWEHPSVGNARRRTRVLLVSSQI